jgi:hypothetical protein
VFNLDGYTQYSTERRLVEGNALWVLALEVCEYLEIGVPVLSKQ